MTRPGPAVAAQTDARNLLFAGLIDYAGLFPPASLDLAGAVTGYREARADRAGWIAGRFLCPTSRLEDLAGVLTATMRPGERQWRVGVIFDLAPGRAAAEAASFHRQLEPAALVDLAEARLPADASPAEIVGHYDAGAAVAPDSAVFLEIPTTGTAAPAIRSAVAAVAAARSSTGRAGGAKIRCGGLTTTDFPPPKAVAEFVVACTEEALPFKATAGLHHPIRHHDPELGVERHGFLNLLAATGVARTGGTMQETEAAVTDTDPGSFAMTSTGLQWRDHSIDVGQLDSLRRGGLIAYGSCDFLEPVGDLRTMGFLAS